MASRVEAHDSLDFFPTPPWATRALCEWLVGKVGPELIKERSVWEPACGTGSMAEPLREYFRDVCASDIHGYGYGEVLDFLWPSTRRCAWIITNPPFILGEQFAATAIARADVGAALLVRTAFLESADRYRHLFEKHAPIEILQFVERVPMFKGRLDRYGSTATSYCWLVWRKNQHGFPYSRETAFHWIAPCRKRLERDSDYPP
jgi:hypothetical protein